MNECQNCFQRWWPIWRRYRLGKQIVNKIEAMGKFKGQSEFQAFSDPAPLPGIQYRQSENFTYFEATIVAYNRLLKALQDESINMIGLYGMGGSGKTTLVTEVGKQAEELNLFDRVILVSVSQAPNIRSLQGTVAAKLSLKLEEEGEEDRAQRLWLHLKEKRILLIADDLWGELNSEDIGIRLDNDDKGRSKVLVTTRRQELCNLMNCQKKIQLGLLSEDEGWTLFKKHSKIDDLFSSKSLNDVPRELCKQCKGLPIAIVAVGSSLKEKSKVEWDVALHSLRNSEAIDDHVDGVTTALSCLKLSYNYLRNKEAELLFLMCSMFPEDYEIFIEDLIRYAIGLGVGKRFSCNNARSRIKAAINKLVDSCLLMHFGHTNHVKMHDMVRDAALWIAQKSEDHKILVNRDKYLSTLAEDDGIKQYFAISLWCKEIDQISHQLDAPHLEILSINTENRSSLDLSHASFEGIEGLKVMAVINSYSYWGRTSLSLPQSTQFLTNLRTLRLNGWYLGNMSFLVSLTRLEILDLHLCSFKELPNEMGKIKRLKVLDLSRCKIENYNYEAIGNCLELEELYVYGDHPVSHSQGVVDIVTLPKLERFVIQTGDFRSYDYEESTRVLGLENFNISNLGSSEKNLLQIAENACLKAVHGGCKSIIPDMVGVVGGMNDLSCLSLCNCSEIEYLIDTTSTDAGSLQVDAWIPRLVRLELSALENLKELHRGPPLQHIGFFEKLEELYIRKCQQLHKVFPGECNLCNLKILNIGNYSPFYTLDSDNCIAAEVLFSVFVAQSLQQLEELAIRGCKELKHIIGSGGEQSSTTNPHLVLPNLKKLSVHFCTKLEYIFPISCVGGLAQLKDIEISMAPELKYIFSECDYKNDSSHQNKNQIMLPHLELLELNRLKNLIGICPENYQARWPTQLELRLLDCPQLSTSWIAIMVGSEQRLHLNERVVLCEDQQRHLPSKLQRLWLEDSPELNLISWVGASPKQILSLQCLKHLTVVGCENLKSLFSMVAHKSLPELVSITIDGCRELEEIIAENEELEHLYNAEVFFPKLTDITVKNCNKLKSLFPVAMVTMLPQLSILNIANDTQLEEVFRHSNEDNAVDEKEIVLPKLTRMELFCLPKFVDICPGFKLLAVKLQQLRINHCPKTTATLRAKVTS